MLHLSFEFYRFANLVKKKVAFPFSPTTAILFCLKSCPIRNTRPCKALCFSIKANKNLNDMNNDSGK